MTPNDTSPNHQRAQAPSVLSQLPRTRPQRASPRRRPAATTTKLAPAPKQGFEPESELEAGVAVAPPSAGELAASLAGLASELLESAASASAKALKDGISRLLRH